MRPRIVGQDDLFSNYHQTTKPCVALFLDFEGNDKCVVVMGGQNWSVEAKKVRHNVREEVQC